MKHLVAAILLFLSVSILSPPCNGAPLDWSTYNGEIFQGDVVKFDFQTKQVILEDRSTGARSTVDTAELDLKSKRQLMLSPFFHNSYPSEGMWPKEKITLVAIAVLSPVVLLIIGMWLAGMFVARRFNPFSALGAFLGSWIAGVILVVCYIVFASKSEGSGQGFIWVGSIIAVLVMTLYVSGIYNTSFIRGFLILIGQFAFAGLLAFLIVYGMDSMMEPDEVQALWEKWIFAPTGLVHGPPDPGY